MKIIIILVLITNIISCNNPTVRKSRTIQKEVRKIKELKYSRYEIEKIESDN